jgi:biopolymer transport protein ExbD
VKRAEAAPVRSEINVTPLVDVVLVLLIIFMVVTPMLSQGPPVELPEASEPPKKPEDSKQVVVTVQEDGKVWIAGTSVTNAGLPGRLQEMLRSEPGSSVVIKGDAGAEYGLVKRVMLDVRDAGFRQVALIAEKHGTAALP